MTVTVTDYLSYINWVDDTDTVIASGTAETNLPVSNVAVTGVYEYPWQTTSGTDHLDITFASAQSIQLFGLFGVSFGASDTVRIRASNTSLTAGDLLDTGALAAGVVSGYDAYVYIAAAAITAKYIRFDFSASAAFRVGRAWVGPAGQSTRGIASSSHEWKDTSDKVYAPYSRTRYVNAKPKYREMSWTYCPLTEGDAKDFFKQVDRVAGSSGEVVFVPDASSAYLQEEVILGVMAQTSPINHPEFAVFDKAYQIEQSR